MITHVVLLAFKPEVSATEQQSIARELSAMQSKCFREGTQDPYIKSIWGGKNETSEGFANGLTYSVSHQPPCLFLMDIRHSSALMLTPAPTAYDETKRRPQFVVAFDTAADKAWYLIDPVHMDFVGSIQDKVAAMTMTDFEAGVF